jgi:hypothetical protein
MRADQPQGESDPDAKPNGVAYVVVTPEWPR